jgi:hypothetical protein
MPVPSSSSSSPSSKQSIRTLYLSPQAAPSYPLFLTSPSPSVLRHVHYILITGRMTKHKSSRPRDNRSRSPLGPRPASSLPPARGATVSPLPPLRPIAPPHTPVRDPTVSPPSPSREPTVSPVAASSTLVASSSPPEDPATRDQPPNEKASPDVASSLAPPDSGHNNNNNNHNNNNQPVGAAGPRLGTPIVLSREPIPRGAGAAAPAGSSRAAAAAGFASSSDWRGARDQHPAGGGSFGVGVGVVSSSFENRGGVWGQPNGQPAAGGAAAAGAGGGGAIPPPADTRGMRPQMNGVFCGEYEGTIRLVVMGPARAGKTACECFS